MATNRTKTDASDDDIDILRMRIKYMDENFRDQQKRKDQQHYEAIGRLKKEKDDLNVKIGEQADIILKLNTNNLSKDEEIKYLQKRSTEMKEEKIKLEMAMVKMKEKQQKSDKTYKEQEKKIKKLENELSDIKGVLKYLQESKEEDTKLFHEQLDEIRAAQQMQLEEQRQQHEEQKKQFEDLKSFIKDIAKQDRIVENTGAQVVVTSNTDKHDVSEKSTPVQSINYKMPLPKK